MKKISNYRTSNSNYLSLEPLLTDELFSSWLIRAAFGFSCKPLVFTGTIWPDWRVWTIDRDRCFNPLKMKILTQYFDLPKDYFQPSFLEGYIQKMTHRSLVRKGAWPWLLSYGCRNRHSLGGIQFCPICFSTDPAPYFRYYWRFAWNVNCLKHACKLIDRCQRCSNPIEFQLAAKDGLNYIQCQCCGFKLGESKIEQATASTLCLQRKLDSYYNMDSVQVFGQKVAPSEIFIFIRIIIGFARKAANNKTTKQAQFLTTCGVQEPHLHKVQSTLSFECLPISDRERLLNISSIVLSMYLKDIKIAVNKSSLTSSYLLDAYIESSFIFNNILQVPESYSRAKSVISRSVKRSVRSKSVVKSMEARLMRRARLWKP